MKKYTVNIDLINKVIPAVSNDQYRPHWQGVYIHDTDGIRNYVATNGHILFKCAEKGFEGDSLENPVILRLNKPLKNKAGLKGELTIVDNDTAVIKYAEKTVCDIIDAEFPDYQRLIDSGKFAEEIQEYVVFAPEYMAELKKFIPTAWYNTPRMKDKTAMGQWFYNDEKAFIEYTALMMPLRV